MSDDKRLTVVEALRMAMESLAERRDEASNAILDCDRTVRIIDGALQRHEEESCQKTNANAGTGAKSAESTEAGSKTTEHTSQITTAHDSTTTPVTPSAKPSQPAEPEVVSRLRQWMNAPEGDRSILICLLREMAGGSLTHIDTLSARLKMAEKLLGEIRNAFLDDRFGDYLNIVDAFLAGKGEA